MGFFTKNTLMIDETIDVVAHVTIMSLAHYLLKGELLNNTQRGGVCDDRIAFHGADASFWAKTKLCMAADKLAREIIGSSRVLSFFESAYLSDNQEAKKEANEEIGVLARAMVMQLNLA